MFFPHLQKNPPTPQEVHIAFINSSRGLACCVDLPNLAVLSTDQTFRPRDDAEGGRNFVGVHGLQEEGWMECNGPYKYIYIYPFNIIEIRFEIYIYYIYYSIYIYIYHIFKCLIYIYIFIYM